MLIKAGGDNMSYLATDIASWFIVRNDRAINDYGDELSILKLIKLAYYAEGCSIASDNGSLFDEKILAWEHGPVIKSIWDKYKNSANKYNLRADDSDYEAVAKISDNDQDVLEGVFDAFGVYSAWGLRNKTHDEDPWKITTNNGKKLGDEIPRALIEKYFKEHYVAA